MITRSVKNKARGQSHWSRASNWGIVHFCALYTFWVKKTYESWLIQFFSVCKKKSIPPHKIAKKAKIHYLLFLIISSMIFELQRRTIPHLRAFDQWFWFPAWILTLGVILSDLWTKISVANFLYQSQVGILLDVRNDFTK